MARDYSMFLATATNFQTGLLIDNGTIPLTGRRKIATAALVSAQCSAA